MLLHAALIHALLGLTVNALVADPVIQAPHPKRSTPVCSQYTCPNDPTGTLVYQNDGTTTFECG